jgi:hypothetical protein
LGWYVGHVVTNVGGVYRRLLKAKPKGTIYDIVPKVKQQEAMQWLQANAFASYVVGKCEHFKNIDYAGYTERENLQEAR